MSILRCSGLLEAPGAYGIFRAKNIFWRLTVGRMIGLYFFYFCFSSLPTHSFLSILQRVKSELVAIKQTLDITSH
jgi:hypothetical protein